MKVAWHQGRPSNTRLRATEDQGKPQLRPPFQFYRLARKAANELRVDVDKYLANISMLAKDFTDSKEIINREDFEAALRQAMMETQFTLVLGGKSLGKSTIANYSRANAPTGSAGEESVSWCWVVVVVVVVAVVVDVVEVVVVVVVVVVVAVAVAVVVVVVVVVVAAVVVVVVVVAVA